MTSRNRYILLSQSFSRFLNPIKYISALMRAVCLSSQSNLQFLEFGNIFSRRNTDFEFKYQAETIDISLKINDLKANRSNKKNTQTPSMSIMIIPIASQTSSCLLHRLFSSSKTPPNAGLDIIQWITTQHTTCDHICLILISTKKVLQ